jgi:hypothetical protein
LSDTSGHVYHVAFPELAYVAPEAAGNSWYPYTFMTPMERNELGLSSALARHLGLQYFLH